MRLMKRFGLSLRRDQRVALDGGPQGPGGRLGSGPRDLGGPARGSGTSCCSPAPRWPTATRPRCAGRRPGCGRRAWGWPGRWPCTSPAIVSLARAGRAARPRHASRLPRDTSALASQGMRIGGALLLLFVVYHLLHLTAGIAASAFRSRPRLRQRRGRAAADPGRRDLRRRGPPPRAPPPPRPVGRDAQPRRPARRGGAAPASCGGGAGGGDRGRFRVGATGRAGRMAAMTRGGSRPDDAARHRTVRTARRTLAAPSKRAGAGRPDATAAASDHRGGRRAGRRLGGGHAGRARLPRALPQLSRLAPPGTQRGRAGRHQRRARTTGNDGDSVERLFHDTLEGRRLPLARVQRVPAGRALRRASSTRRSRRACRSRASTAGTSRTGRSAARSSRARSTRGGRRASSSCSAPTRRSSKEVAAAASRAAAARDARSDRGRWAGARRRRARPGVGRLEVHAGDAVVLAHRRLCQRLLPVDQRQGARTPPRSGGRTGAARPSPTRASCSSIPRALPAAGEHQAKLTLMSESLRNDARLWVPRGRATTAGPRPSPRPSATTSSSAAIRATATSCRATSASRAAKAVCDEGRGVGPGGRASISTSREAAAASAPACCASATATSSSMYEHITGDDPLRGADADRPGRALHDGRALGRLRPHEHHPRPLRRSARPTSPIRAPTGSAPARSCRAWPTATSSCRARWPATWPARRCPWPRTRAEARSALAEVRTRIETLLAISRDGGRRRLPPRARPRAVGGLWAGAQPTPAWRKAIDEIAALREAFWQDVTVPGGAGELNQELERAGRVADFLELGELDVP